MQIRTPSQKSTVHQEDPVWKFCKRMFTLFELTQSSFWCGNGVSTPFFSTTPLTLSEQRRLNISVHNAKVRENRKILKDLINVNCFPAKQQLAFCSNDESSISSNRGNYVEPLHTLAAQDERLARHLETSAVFSGFSNIIQNDLIAAVDDVVRYDVKEISAAPFVAAKVDEPTDVTNKAQISVIMWLKARWLVK